MEKLGTTYKANGFTFHLVKRTGDICHYKAKAIKNKTSDIYIHEVFIIQNLPAQKIFGRKYPDREKPPKNEHFGDFGWSFTSETLANRKYNELIKQN